MNVNIRIARDVFNVVTTPFGLASFRHFSKVTFVTLGGYFKCISLIFLSENIGWLFPRPETRLLQVDVGHVGNKWHKFLKASCLNATLSEQEH